VIVCASVSVCANKMMLLRCVVHIVLCEALCAVLWERNDQKGA